jgi:hypothetical protein
MSVAKLFVSGVLVASGLILGAFTLHGYFDPQWQVRQMQAGETRARVSGAWTTSTHVAAGRTARQEAASPQPTVRKTSVKADAGPPNPESVEAKAAAAKARKRLAEKKLAEKRQAEQARRVEQAAQQQATFQWPWNWFAN